jgi:UDP-glucuronate 4-epimerase
LIVGLHMAKYLITGGAGFIGSHVAETLLARGDDVAILDSLDPYYPVELKRRNLELLCAAGLEQFIEGDILDAATVERVFSEFRPEYLIHLAAKAGVRPSVQDPLSYMDTNVRGTVQLLECAKSLPLRKMVFASSSSVYGSTNRVPFSEDEPAATPLSPYAASKVAGEACCHAYHHIYDLPIVCLRFFTVYGPRQRPDLAINKFVGLIAAGKPIPMYGDGTSERDYTFVSDVVHAVLLAAASDISYDVINIGGGSPITLCGMIEKLQEVMERATPIEQFPEQSGDMPRTFADITKAQRLLGWSPSVSLADGLREFVQWKLAS